MRVGMSMIDDGDTNHTAALDTAPHTHGTNKEDNGDVGKLPHERSGSGGRGGGDVDADNGYGTVGASAWVSIVDHEGGGECKQPTQGRSKRRVSRVPRRSCSRSRSPQYRDHHADRKQRESSEPSDSVPRARSRSREPMGAGGHDVHDDPEASFESEGTEHPYADGDEPLNTARIRSLVFTIHFRDGVDVDDAQLIAAGVAANLRKLSVVERFAFQLEKCPDTGRLHLQGFIMSCSGLGWEAKDKRKKAGWNNIFARIRERYADCLKAPWKRPCVNPRAAWAYCTKDETRVPETEPYTQGDMPEPGKRNDLHQFHDEVKKDYKEGKVELQALQDKYVTVEARHTQYFDRVVARNTQPRTKKTKVVFISGPAGTGKSHRAREWAMRDYKEEPFVVTLPDKKHSQIWWDGINENGRSKAIMIDEFAPDVMSPQMWNQLCDKGRMKVPVKGRMEEFNPEVLYICSNYAIDSCFPDSAGIMTTITSRIDEAWQTAYHPQWTDPEGQGREEVGKHSTCTRVKPRPNDDEPLNKLYA